MYILSYFTTCNIAQTDSIIYPPEGDLSPGGAALVTFDPDLLEAVSKHIVFNKLSLCALNLSYLLSGNNKLAYENP